MQKTIITTILIALLALTGASAAPSGVPYCVKNAQACLAWPDFLDNAVKRVAQAA